MSKLNIISLTFKEHIYFHEILGELVDDADNLDGLG